MIDIKDVGDIVKKKSDGMICYITNVVRYGTLSQYISYQYTTKLQKNSTISYNLHNEEDPFELIAKRLLDDDLEPLKKIFIWKSNRWLAEYVSSFDGKNVWTVGHGKVSFGNIALFTDKTKCLFKSISKEDAPRYHHFKKISEFISDKSAIFDNYQSQDKIKKVKIEV